MLPLRLFGPLYIGSNWKSNNKTKQQGGYFPTLQKIMVDNFLQEDTFPEGHFSVNSE